MSQCLPFLITGVLESSLVETCFHDNMTPKIVLVIILLSLGFYSHTDDWAAFMTLQFNKLPLSCSPPSSPNPSVYFSADSEVGKHLLACYGLLSLYKTPYISSSFLSAFSALPHKENTHSSGLSVHKYWKSGTRGRRYWPLFKCALPGHFTHGIFFFLLAWASSWFATWVTIKATHNYFESDKNPEANK